MPDWRKNGSVTEHLKNDLLSRRASHRVGRLRHLPISASAREHRSASVKREFQLTHPCPATGPTSGACPGYVKDHVLPLACGGPDAVSNLQ
jgi:hypothetical protein